MQVELIPYEGFPEDWRSLSAAGKKAVADLLKRIQAGPYQTDLQKECAIALGERYALQLPEGYVVYWTITSNLQHGSIVLNKVNKITVKLTGIEHRKV